MNARSRSPLGVAREAGRRLIAATAVIAAFSSCGEQSPTKPGTGKAPSGLGAVNANGVPFPVEFFIVAHQDDWQLFFGDRGSAAAQTAAKVVFVYSTAGGGTDFPPYWQAREQAANASVDAITPPGPWACTNPTVNAHEIYRCTKANTVSYYLHLPNPGDGAALGLSGLRDGAISTLDAVDGTETYASWGDLASTLQSIIATEAGTEPDFNVAIHAQETDRRVNSSDHSDHLATGDLTRAATAGRDYNRFWYIGYESQYYPANLTPNQLAAKWATVIAYDDVMKRLMGETIIATSSVEAWVPRTVYRSEPSSGTPPPPPGPPSAPSALVAGSVTGIRVDLVWADNSTNEQGFNVERAPDVAGVAGTYAVIASVGANVHTYSDPVEVNVRYWYRVVAYNSLGASNYSNESSAILAAPAAPSGLQGTGTSTTRIDLTWADNATDESGFRIERAPDVAGAAGTYAQIASVDVDVRAYSSNGLLAGTTYWYRVRAYNAVGTSAYSTAANATTMATPPPPNAPSALVATPVSGVRINLAWTDNSTDEQGFRVERAPDVEGVAGTYAQIASVGANVTTYNSNGLQLGTRYWYRVRAHNAGATSAYTTETSATTYTLPDGPPSALVATVASGSRINLSWTDNSTNEQGFRVQRAPDVAGAPGTFAQIASVGVNVVTYGNTGLPNSTRYWYRVRAYNQAGTSAFSNIADGTTLSPPAPPTDLQAITASPSMVDVTWTDNADNEEAYRVDRAPDVAGAPGSYTQVVTLGANVTSYRVSGLASGVTYWFRVRAQNAVGNSAWLAGASATTMPAVPPSDLAVRAYLIGTQRNADLTWTPGSEARVDVWRAGVKVSSSVVNTGGPRNYTSGAALGLSVAYQVCLVGKTDAASCTLVVNANY